MTIEATLERIAIALEKICATNDLKAAPDTPATTIASAPASASTAPAPETTATSGESKAARKPRSPKSAATTAEPATPAAPAPATAAAVATATSPSSPPLTLSDVRTALTECQTRKGTKDVPQAILSKYSSNGLTSGLKEEDYAKVIAECKAA